MLAGERVMPDTLKFGLERSRGDDRARFVIGVGTAILGHGHYPAQESFVGPKQWSRQPEKWVPEIVPGMSYSGNFPFDSACYTRDSVKPVTSKQWLNSSVD